MVTKLVYLITAIGIGALLVGLACLAAMVVDDIDARRRDRNGPDT